MNITESADLLLPNIINHFTRTTDEHIRIYSHLPQEPHGMLNGLGFRLAQVRRNRDVNHVNKNNWKIILVLKQTTSLQERNVLVVTRSTTNLYKNKIIIACDILNPPLYL